MSEEPDEHPWRAAVLLAAALVAAGLAWTIWIFPSMKHSDAWIMGEDVWAPLHAASWVANGHFAHLYDPDPTWVAGPLLPVLLTPLVWIGRWFHLTVRIPATAVIMPNGEVGITFGPDQPTLWPIFAAYGIGMSALLLAAARRVVFSVGTVLEGRDRVRLALLVQVCIAVILMPATAIYWGHYEDVLALALMLFAVAAISKERWMMAGLLLGVSVATKQWALLMVPMVFFRVPAPHRSRFLLLSVGLPGVAYAIPLIFDREVAWQAFFHAPTAPWRGHPAPWAPSEIGRFVGATPARIIWVAGALAIAGLARARRDLPSLLAVGGLVFALRLALEPAVPSYYLAAPVCFLLAFEALSRGTVVRTSGLAAGAMLWYFVPAPDALWWVGLMALLGAMAAPAIGALLSPRVPA